MDDPSSKDEAGRWERGLAAAFGADDSAPDEVPEQLGPYRIRGMLGEGGMGIVYLAEESFPAREVALKVVRPHLATRAMLRRFELEAQLLGRMQHPGVARVYAAGTFEGPHGPQPYLAMERVDGVALDQWLTHHDPPIRDRIELLARVADAVQHAHMKGAIHRDLKAANVLVDGEGRPKVVDFGIARAVEPDAEVTVQTQAGQILGTLGYMAPEQLVGDPDGIDSRCDVYALGAMLYEALAGHVPIQVEGKSFATAVREVLETEPVPLGKVHGHLAGDLQTVVHHAIEKDPERRYPTAAALAEDLRRYLRREPILARPATALYRLGKLAQRHKLASVFAVAFLLALIGGLAGTTLYAVRAGRSRALAEEQRDLKGRINDILADILASASPFGRGADTRVLDVLHETEARLAGELSEDPEVEGALRLALARAYRELGSYDEALASAVRADELFTRLHGDADLQTIQARSERTRAIVSRYELEGQEVYQGQLLALAERTLGPGHPETLQIRGDRLVLEMLQGRGHAQVDAARQLLEDRQLYLGAEHPDVPFAMQLLASAYSQARLLEEAEHWMRKAAELLERIEGPASGRAFKTRLELASILSLAGRSAEAQRMIDDLVAEGREVFGPRHWVTTELMRVQGSEYLYTRQPEKAVPILRECLELAREHVGPEHDVSLGIWLDYAVALRMARQYDLAEEELSEVLAAHRRYYGEEDVKTASTWLALGVLYRRTGRFDEALECYERCRDIDRALLPPDHGDALSTQRSIALLHMDMDRPDLAHPVFEQLLDVHRRNQDPRSAVVLQGMEDLARCLERQGEYTSALEQIEERLAIDSSLGDEAHRRRELRLRRARCLGALGRVEEQRELVLELTRELDGLEEEEAEQRVELEALRSELDA